jgi:ketosteroid isomerase-like protein
MAPLHWLLRFTEIWLFLGTRLRSRIAVLEPPRKEEMTMASGTDERETLAALNRGYLLAAEKSDVAWYAEHLADDYRATNPDGSFVDKAGFLARIGRPHTLTSFRAPEVHIQRVGDLALIHASFEDTRPDGGHGRGRYTDIWQRRNGRWLCVSAHFVRC